MRPHDMRLLFALLAPFALLNAQPLDVIVAMEMSPGTEHATGLIQARHFPDGDRAGIVGFRGHAEILQPLTDDNDAIARALQKAGARVGVELGAGVAINTAFRADVVGAIKEACAELGEPDSQRKHAIVLLFAGEDPTLRSHQEVIQQLLSAAQARLYAVAITRMNATDQGPLARRPNLTYNFPALTAQLLSKIAKDSGGKIYKGGWDMKDILKDARKP